MDLYEREEEELLSLQARMENGGVAPAAKVERVGKSSGKGGQQDAAVAASHDKDFREAQRGVPSEMHTIRESDLLPILGNVIERDVSRGRGSEDGLCTTTGNLKKNDNEMNSEERGRNKMWHFPVPEHRVKSKFTLGRSREVNRSDIGDKSLQPEMPVGDADSILHNMTPDEVEKARDEILSRFKGSTIDFLKKRGAKKRNVERDLQRQSEGVDVVKEKLSDIAMETASSPREPFLNSMLFSENLLSRLRFGRDGSLDSLLAPQKQTWESVLKRDPIRHKVQALGRHGQYYYSFDELYVLCRSTEFRQRVMGMSFLGDLLSTCRKHLVRNSLLDISPELNSVIQKEGLGKQLPLKWVAIWNHATYSLQIAKLIRFSMDDSNIQVVVESLKSMTQYLGASSDEIKLMEACDAHPAIGSPRLAFSHIQRQGCGTEWLSAPLDLQSTAKTIETGQHRIPLAEEELDEQDLARVDPLSGLLNMNLVGRVMHLMQRKDFQSETSRKLGLQCLLVLAQAGTRVCEKLASESIVLETLYNSLTVRTHGNLVDILTLNILKLLFQSSKRFCAESSTQPIRRKIKAIILSNTLDSPRNGTALDCFKVCIQIWRAWLINQTSILYFDDAFSSLCLVMFPSWDRSTDWKRAWPCAREGLLLAAISCTKNNISAQCCQALVKQVMDWMQEMPYPISFIMDGNADSKEGHMKYELASVLSAAFFLFSCSWKFAESWEDSDTSHLKGHFSKLTFLGESSLIQFWRHWSSGHCGQKYQYSAEQNMKTLSYASLACCMTEFMLTCKGTKPGDMACIFDEIIASIGKSIVDSTAMGTQIEQIIQPWQAYSLQHILNLGRIFTIISSFALEHKALSNVTAIADASIWLLVNLPPGSEDLALRLLSLLFSTEYCHQPFCNALKAVEGSLTRFDILSGIKNVPETIDAECLRLDALSGVSRNILGYNLESDTSEKQSSLLNYDGIESMILHLEESRLPLEDTWMFSKPEVPEHKQQGAATFKRAILLWIIGNELQNRLSSISCHKKLFHLIDFVFNEVHSDDQNELNTWMDESIQASTTFLVNHYLGLISDNSDSNVPSCSSIAKYVTEKFASESFGNSFYGAILACLLCETVSGVKLQEEILSILKDEHAMHHIPRLQYLLGPLNNYFTSTVEGILDWKLLADILGSTEFGKCLESKSALADICLHNAIFLLETKGKTHGPTLLHRLSKWKGTDVYHHILKYLLHWSPLSKDFDTGVKEDRLALLQSLGAELPLE